ncbi:SHOCT domain-containing protein [Gordonia sp. HNM0687]|uniref:SHOCT domain-containing protein n=1 Tax=Gordonia mangrovi TaxID=2665643 RepID=A0A6L7GP82_9ACTN|nr:SHOCT domain-containing protein [Gordonia mangrovi]MDY6809035.1 SHOCT domain-containing protein [Actinomycetota bacterium]MXP21709.1 SHOCT domain-containing protein [Gordonia mangrovi]UVF80441.1 SHOCT domain-containing protein [Gordonia mangrovi]
MNQALTPEADAAIADVAQRHGLSYDAVVSMLVAVNAGGGTMAQFSIPELGGSGQWMRGGMTMVGNMFDNALKARVDALCNELSQLLATTRVFPPLPTAAQGGFTSNNWWPDELGVPSSSGGQNQSRYAIFPSTRRLAIDNGGLVRIYDTGDHNIGGVQQQQGGPSGSLTFTSQYGTFDVSSLPEVGGPNSPGSAGEPSQDQYSAPAPMNPEPTAPQQDPMPSTPQMDSDAADPTSIVNAIESLAGLHQRGILSDEEFAAKKAELLGRL